jgi:hypothetical protein
MRKIYSIAVLMLINIVAFAQENTTQVISKITNVTVFISGAQVNRQSELVDIPQGVSILSFSGLSSAIEAQSIQAKGEGNFTILSVTQQKNFLLEKKNSEQKNAYLNAIEELTDKIATLRNESEVYKAEEEMLSKNQMVMGPNVNYDLTKLKLALDFQKQRLTEAKNKQISINKEIARLQLSLNNFNKQLNELNGKSAVNANDVLVKISAKANTKGKFTLSYMVANAAWYPTYDIRAKDVASSIELVYKANVSQSSGEDWKNVKLTLSSGNPKSDQAKPELGKYNLGFISAGYGFGAPLSSTRIVRGKITDNTGQALPGAMIRVKGSSVSTSSDGNGNYTLQLPSGNNVLSINYIGFVTQELAVANAVLNVVLQEDSKMLQEVVVTGNSKFAIRGMASAAKVERKENLSSVAVGVNTVQQQTNVNFNIQDPYTVLSDGKQFTVDIGNFDFKAEYEYYAAPKITEEAFLTAKISGFDEVNLLSGEANIFFEGTFLGKSLLDVQTSSDTLTVSLGVDKNVVIKREKQKDFNEKQFIGSSQRDNKHFIIDIKNRKAQAINLTVEDQFPISTSSDITVEKQEISGANYNDADGKLVWKFKMQPNEQKKLALKYQVKYPKNRPINLE